MGRWAKYQQRLNAERFRGSSTKPTNCDCGRAVTNGSKLCQRCRQLEIVKTEDRRVRAPRAGGQRTYCERCGTINLGSKHRHHDAPAYLRTPDGYWRVWPSGTTEVHGLADN